MANTKWPFKDMAVGDTLTIHGHPPKRVSNAAKAYAGNTGWKFRTRKEKLLNGNVCVVVTRLTDEGFHPDPARDPEGPGPLFARRGHLPSGYAGPWPFESLGFGQTATYDAREYSQEFLRQLPAATYAKGYKVKLEETAEGTGVLASATVTRVTVAKPVTGKVTPAVTHFPRQPLT